MKVIHLICENNMSEHFYTCTNAIMLNIYYIYIIDIHVLKRAEDSMTMSFTTGQILLK